jgi:cobalt-zinc-cadmium efflux system protein
MAVDAGVSFGVVVAGLLITLTGLSWIDPVVSIIISGIIVITTWSLMKDSLNLALDAVPEHINRDDVKKYLEGLTGVCAVHDLHIWAISTKETGLTAHLVHGDITIAEDVIQKATVELTTKFNIGHATLQVEKDKSGRFCKLEPDTII